jgi:hypothetical protein
MQAAKTAFFAAGIEGRVSKKSPQAHFFQSTKCSSSG